MESSWDISNSPTLDSESMNTSEGSTGDSNMIVDNKYKPISAKESESPIVSLLGKKRAVSDTLFESPFPRSEL